MTPFSINPFRLKNSFIFYYKKSYGMGCHRVSPEEV